MSRVDARDPYRSAPRNPYASLVGAAMQKAMAYRGQRLMSVLSSIVFLTIQYFVWKAVFATKTMVGPFSFVDMQTYIVLVFVMNSLIPPEYEMELYRSIQDGSVALALTRPVDFQWSQLSLATGATLAELVFRCIAVAAAALVLPIAVPARAELAALFLLSVLFGMLTRFLITYLVGLFCFWMMNVLGLQWLRMAIMNILSGAIVPLPLLPGGVRTLAVLSPFPGLLYVPATIYLGYLSASEALQAIAIQLVWVVALWFVARWLFRVCVARLVVQGG